MPESYGALVDVLFKALLDSELIHSPAPLPSSIASINQHDKAAVDIHRRFLILLDSIVSYAASFLLRRELIVGNRHPPSPPTRISLR